MLDKITPYFFGVFLISILVEAFYSRRNELKLYERRDTSTSIALGVIGVITRPPKNNAFLTVVFHEWIDILKNGYSLKSKI